MKKKTQKQNIGRNWKFNFSKNGITYLWSKSRWFGGQRMFFAGNSIVYYSIVPACGQGLVYRRCLWKLDALCKSFTVNQNSSSLDEYRLNLAFLVSGKQSHIVQISPNIVTSVNHVIMINVIAYIKDQGVSLRALWFIWGKLCKTRLPPRISTHYWHSSRFLLDWQRLCSENVVRRHLETFYWRWKLITYCVFHWIRYMTSLINDALSEYTKMDVNVQNGWQNGTYCCTVYCWGKSCFFL